jgi:hypothetical protein
MSTVHCSLLTESTCAAVDALCYSHRWLTMCTAACRPCCTKEADESSVSRWIHAAHAASLSVLWMEDATPALAAAAAVERDQLLSGMALAAAATFASGSSTSAGSSNSSSSMTSSSSHGKQLQQLDAAAVALLAAAVLPPMVPFGSSKRVSVSRFMPALLGSDCCHVLLHALAVAAEANAASAATGIVSSGNSGSSMLPALANGPAADATAGCQVVVAAPQQPSLAWLLLRMICAQCTQARLDGCAYSRASSQQSSGSDSDGAGEQPIPAAASAAETRLKHSSMVQPQQVLRVVQAYAEHIPSVAPLVPRLLGSLHVLLCQAALVTQQQQQLQPAGAAALVKESAANSTGSSSSRGSLVFQLLHRAPSVPSLRGLAEKLAPLWESMSSQLTAGQQQQHVQQVPASPRTHRRASSSSSGRCQGLGWQLPTCAYVVLSVALAVQGRGLGPASSSDQLHDGLHELEDCQGEFSIVLAAARMAAAVLQVLLPALLGTSSSTSSSSASAAEQLQQVKPVAASGSNSSSSSPVKEAPVALQGVSECSLAALQALVLLSRHLQSSLQLNLGNCNKLLACNLAECKTAEEAAAAKAAQAAAAGLKAALDSRLCSLLEAAVSSWSAPEVTGSSGSAYAAGSAYATGQQPCCSSSSGAATTVQAALQHHMQQELRCWAAAVLAACYGQLGASSSQGELLAAARQPGAAGADAELLLADGGPALPVHAAVLAAGCKVLGQQLTQQQQQQQCDEPHASQGSGERLSVKLSAAVDRAALQAALGYVYSGTAAVPEAGLKAQLAAVGDSRKQQQQQQGCTLQQLQETGQQQLAGLGRLAKKLQLQLLAALCRQVTPSPGQQLQLLHPQLCGLLPQQLLLQMPAENVQQQHEHVANGPCCHSIADGVCSDGDSSVIADALQAGIALGNIHADVTESAAAAGAAASLVEDVQGNHKSSNSSSTEKDAHDQQPSSADLYCCKPEDAVMVSSSIGHGSSSSSDSSSLPSLHSSSSDYLDMLARWMEPEAVPAAMYSRNEQQQQYAGLKAIRSAEATPVVHAEIGLGYADVLLAAPAVVQHQAEPPLLQQQQAQEVLALLPAHQVLLSGCGYFEALFSQRWHTSGGQEPYQDSNSSSSMYEAGRILTSSAEGNSGRNEAQVSVQRMRRLPVVLLPEADVHVAAALQHWLYTGELHIALPQHTTASAAAVGLPQQQQQQQAGAVRLNGCSPACHTCRSLLRLWRCADLLLLPALQEQCLAAVEGAVLQVLPCGCCLAMLQDCCQLGVAPAADSAIAGLLARFGECWLG